MGADLKPTLNQINLVVSDLERSLAFYQLAGLEFGEPTGLHASLAFPSGFMLALDQWEFAKVWSSGIPDAVGGGSVVLSLSVPERSDVDSLWSRMVEAGYASSQSPYDTFWGSRFAVVLDPDGYQIGIMSPGEAAHRFWPPTQAPAD